MTYIQKELSSYRYAKQQVTLLSNQLKYLKHDSTVPQAEIHKLQTRLKLARSVARQSKKRAEELISLAPQELNMQEILRMRYITCMRWQDIFDCLGLDHRWIMRLHKRALTNIAQTATAPLPKG